MSAPAQLRRLSPAVCVPVRIYATEELLASLDDQVYVQVADVATLPGIVGASHCMPDAHWGYGFDAADGARPRVTAELAGERLDAARHGPGSDVKGVTAHRLEVAREGAGWRAGVTLDV